MASPATAAAGAIPPSPKLRADVRFHARPGDDAHVIIEDPQRGQFYRVGSAEYALLCEFDGHTPLNVALQRAQQIQPALHLTLPQAAILAQWLESSQLAYRPDATSVAQWGHLANKEHAAKNSQWLNPFFIRIPLLHPDRLLARLVPWTGWFFSLPATLVAIAASVWALAPLTTKWRELMGDLEDLFTPHRQVSLIIIWLVMKILHELGHGIACKRYGGHVREAGATFILFAPAAYIDVTSAWRFASRWHRIHTSAAGMYVEIVISALAAIVWGSSSSEQVRQIAANVILLGTISTVLFNINPLMRFDGYYILGDFLELQNLYESGRSYLHYCLKRYLLGLRVPAPRLPARHATLVRVYGFASSVFYFLARIGTLAALAIVFHGAGLFLALLGLVWWFVLPAARLMRWLFRGPTSDRPTGVRATLVTCGGSAAVVLVLTLAPASLPATAPAIVEYAPPTVIRARTPGFVERIDVVEGESVSEGQLLCVLRNDALRVELAGLESLFERTLVRTLALRQRLPYAPQEHVAYEAAMSELAAVQTRVTETRSRAQDLEIRAPHAGRLVRRRLDRLEGVYLNVGDEIVSLGSEDAKQLHVSIAQDDVEDLPGNDQSRVTVYVPGVGSWNAQLDRLDPRATTKPPHDALCAPNGGPVAVVRGDNGLEFAAPRFSGFISLTADQALRLQVGRRGAVSIGTTSQSLGGALMRVYSRIWNEAIHAQH
jgi:putative peptide zinc metalloprotease protein